MKVARARELRRKLKTPARKWVPEASRPVAPTDNGLAPSNEVVVRVLVLAQLLSEKKYYPYQVEFGKGIIEAILAHDGDVVTALLSRQSGKTQGLAGIIIAIMVIFPVLAKKYPKDERLNLHDDNGVYRGFDNGINFGIYAPKYQQASIMFDRVKACCATKTAKKVFSELKLTIEESNGNTLSFSNGSSVLCASASKTSKIEGETHDVVICEEAQDIDDMKVLKSIHPMVASTNGVIIKIGTATIRKCNFYDAIRTNMRLQMVTGKKRHFFYPYQICQKYNSQYRKYIAQEKIRLGEESDEFRLSYGCEWIFERGMYITMPQLFMPKVAQTSGYFSELHPLGVKHSFPYYSIVAGIDWGEMSDSTVLSFMAVDWNNPVESNRYTGFEGNYTYTFYKKHLTAWAEWQGDSYEVQYQEILPCLRNMPGLTKVAIDANACGRPMYSRLLADLKDLNIEVIGHSFNQKVKSDMYKLLSQELQGGRTTFPAGIRARKTKHYQRFVAQMLDLQKEYRNGNLVVHHPDEKHARDDYPDSFALCNLAASVPARHTGVVMSENNPFFNR